MPSLTTDDQSKCDGDLTESECLKSLKTMKLNKSAGPDGLTTEFYLDFWPEIGPKLVRMLNYAKTHGELPISQRRAIITLLHKQGKDELLIKNWRPISLLCVDFKILTKSLALRVRDILPKLIHENQSGFEPIHRSRNSTSRRHYSIHG